MTRLYQSQYILSKVFNNTNNILKTTFNNTQDYFNAVYDNTKDALRVNIVGGMLPMVDSVQELPDVSEEKQICPVYNDEKKGIDFYQWINGQWVFRGSTVADDEITPEEKETFVWIYQHIEQLKDLVDFNYLVNVQEITLPKNGNVVQVQGEKQNIDDDLNGDKDETTPYRIDIVGYVMSVSTYSNNDALVPDRYYTRITYDSANGGLGTSHIYLQQEEYDYFANLNDGKNKLKVYYITNSTTSPIKHVRYTLNQNNTITDYNGKIVDILDVNNEDGEIGTVYKINCPGYVLGIQTYASNQAVILDKYYTKIVYESDGIHAGNSTIFMEQQEYDYLAGLNNGKNVMDIYYVSKVFPASVTISETQYQIPNETFNKVVIDASGNPKNVQDVLDKDNDESTHIRINVNGYVLDIDGYYNENQSIRKRLLLKMSYNPELDTTDIYMDNESYNYISSLSNGRNIISIYTLGAGIGIDSSRIQSVDSDLDDNSEKAIQNKTVKRALDLLNNKIHELEQEIERLKSN